jgi:hypothetical protein
MGSLFSFENILNISKDTKENHTDIICTCQKNYKI